MTTRHILSLKMGSNILRFKELFSPLDIQKGLIVSLTDRNIPLSNDLTAMTFDDYIKKI